jgi:ABC-type antimicrobial peptide transport system permease subunit
MKQNSLALVLAVVVGVPIGWLVAMLLTPLLWRLEPVLHIELAGHSGPADWIFYVVWVVSCLCLFLAFRFVFLRKKPY